MAFTSPFTAVAGATILAAQHNTYIRDNLNALWAGSTAGDLDYYSSASAKTKVGIGTPYARWRVNAGATAPEWGGPLPRVQTAATVSEAPNIDLYDLYVTLGINSAPTYPAPSGTPIQGQRLTMRIKDDGTPRAITWNAIYRAMGVSLPTTTLASKTMYLGFIYNATDSKWDLIAKAQEV